MSENRGETGGAFDWLGAGGRRAAEPEQETFAPRAPARRRQTGRGGKAKNPNYHQASAYVRKDVYRRVRQALVSGEEDGPDYSTLVESLLIDWLEENGWEVDDLRFRS